MLSQHKAVGWNAYGFRRHYLVAQRIAQNAVLVYASFVREGVAANYSFVRLHVKAYYLREQLARGIKLPGFYPALERQTVCANMKRHDYLFKRSVARALAYAVDCALDLTRSGFNGSEAIRNR